MEYVILYPKILPANSHARRHHWPPRAPECGLNTTLIFTNLALTEFAALRDLGMQIVLSYLVEHSKVPCTKQIRKHEFFRFTCIIIIIILATSASLLYINLVINNLPTLINFTTFYSSIGLMSRMLYNMFHNSCWATYIPSSLNRFWKTSPSSLKMSFNDRSLLFKEGSERKKNTQLKYSLKIDFLYHK